MRRSNKPISRRGNELSQSEHQALFVGTTHKVDEATLGLFGGILGPCFIALFHFIGM